MEEKRSKITPNLYKYIILGLLAGMAVYLSIICFRDPYAYQSTDSFDIWSNNTLAIQMKRAKPEYSDIPIGDREIVQAFRTLNPQMEKFIIEFEGFSPEDTASLIVTLNDKEGNEYYRYECPTSAFGEGPIFYLIGAPDKKLKNHEIYYLHISLDSPGSKISVRTSTKDGIHPSLRDLTIDGQTKEDCALILCHSYTSDFLFGIHWVFILGFTLLFILLISFVPSKMIVKIWDYSNVLFVTGAAFYLFQSLDRDGIYTIEPEYILLNLLILAGAFLIGKGLLPYISLYVSVILMAAWAITNYYVVLFNGNEFMITQLVALNTVANVADSYKYDITPKVLTGVVLCVCFLLIQITADIRRNQAYRIEKRENANADAAVLKKKRTTRIIMFFAERIVFAGIGFALFMSVYNNKLTKIPMYSLEANIGKEGYFLSNMSIVKAYRYEKPASYSNTEIARIISEVEEPEMEAGEITPKNLIVIMNESFSDLSVAGTLKTDNDYMPYIRSLDENTVKGKLFVDCFGGGTSISEYEFLTGNTQKFLPYGANPYVGFCRGSEPGLPTTLKDQGYYAVAMHPNSAVNWNRDNVYPALGFDEFIDIDGYEDYELVRDFVSDKGDYQKIIDYYEDFDKNRNLFIFNVTMQNHGGYDDKNGTLEKTIDIKGIENDSLAEVYLSLIKESDSAFEYLTSYFSKVDEPTMIVMFGDHFPQLSDEFYEELYGGKKKSELSPEAYNLMFNTQYIIWTNYESDFEEPEEISANYLGSFVLRCAGLQLTDYDKFLLNEREKMPAIGMKGVRFSDGRFVSYDTINWDELKDYRMIEYLRIKDRNESYYDFFQIN